MKNNSETVTLDEKLRNLLSNYESEEINFFQQIVNEAEIYKAENMVTCNIITQKEGSNG